jgi:serine/threonine-protein kinase HipA
MQGTRAAILEEIERGRAYRVTYDPSYTGPPISLTMPVRSEPYDFTAFPPFFDGMLPEGAQLDALLRQAKIDRNDPFQQLVTVGADLVGAVTVTPIEGTEP